MCAFASQTNSFVRWENNVKLTWGDFKGSPDNNSAMAMSYITIDCREIKEKDSVTIIVNTLFDKNQSWVKKDFVDEQLLWHEQIHFDLFEVYARKLTELYSKMEFTEKEILSGKLEKIRDSMYAEVEKAHQLLDDDFSSFISEERDKQLQENWNLKIKNELESMKSFSEKTVKLPWKK